LEQLNIRYSSADWRARELSNFAGTPFELDNENILSVEGFIQAVKFPPDDLRHGMTLSFMGSGAKRMGRIAAEEFGCKSVWWSGKKIPYGSPDHHALIARAIRAKVEQVPHVRAALIATEGLTLTHDVGQVESVYTSLPERVFVKILTDLREELLTGNGVSLGLR
jgi:predicted NAD-dependent protein-ADP-ribosyltransferase YbiA (DUF1768 family)